MRQCTGSAPLSRARLAALPLSARLVPLRTHRMSVLAIDHVLLAMPPGAEAQARAFYGGVMLLDEKMKPAALAAPGGAWSPNGPIGVHLGVEKDFRPARKAHPAFVVRDLAGFIARARAQGCEMAEDEPLPGYARIFIYDPFGNRLELIEPDGTPRA